VLPSQVGFHLPRLLMPLGDLLEITHPSLVHMGGVGGAVGYFAVVAKVRVAVAGAAAMTVMVADAVVARVGLDRPRTVAKLTRDLSGQIWRSGMTGMGTRAQQRLFQRDTTGS